MSATETFPMGMPCCRDCAAALEIEGTEQHPYWWCPRCRTAVLTPALTRPDAAQARAVWGS